jgi:hypothetical protein
MMPRFLYVLFEDTEKVVDDAGQVCKILADLYRERVEDEGWFEGDIKRSTALWHLFAYHATQCEIKNDCMNLALAHKAIVEEGCDFVNVYERKS